MTSRNKNSTSNSRRPLHLVAVALLAMLPQGSEAFTPSTHTRSGRAAAVTISGSLKDEPATSEFVPAVKTTRRRPDTQPSADTPLRMIVDERREFEMNLGKAVDTLKQDYPDILTDMPDFSIYHDDLVVVDPTGVTMHGLKNYKNAFRFIHAIINLFYCPERSGLTFRLCYDMARNNIRVSWNAEIVPKAIFGGTKTMLHVDGISVYEIAPTTAKITEHRVEHLVINNAPVRPERGIFHALEQQVIDPNGIPALNAEGLGSGGNGVLRFQMMNPVKPTTSLFSTSSSGGFDNEAFERKNASRKKFGLEPLTPEAFEDLQAQVQQLDKQQRQKQSAAASAAELSNKKGKEGFLQQLFGDVMEDTCESNFDCQRPQVCCDFGFKKSCCSSGMKIGIEHPIGERATVPVPVDLYPPGQGPYDDPRNFF